MNKAIVLLFSRWLKTFGDCMQNVALPIIIFNIWNSTSLLSLTFIAETVPWLVLAPFLTIAIRKYMPLKISYILGNVLRACCVLLLAFSIRNYAFILIIFFVLGILNSCISPVYSTLMKQNIDSEKLSSFLGISMGVDDAVNIAAPILVTIAIGLNVDPVVFIYINAAILLLSAAISVLLPKAWKEESIVEENERAGVKNLMENFADTIRDIKNRDLFHFVFAEGIRSLVEGMCLPVLISYVMWILNKGEEIFTLGQTLNSIAQVIMAFVYILLARKFHYHIILNIGGLLISAALIFIGVSDNLWIYLCSMLIIGSGMAIRQIVAENIIISSFSESEVSGIVSVYNACISFFYIIGYAISALLRGAFAVKTSLLIGGILIFISILRKQKSPA